MTGRLILLDRGFGISCLLHCGRLTVSADSDDSWKCFCLSRTRLWRLVTLAFRHRIQILLLTYLFMLYTAQWIKTEDLLAVTLLRRQARHATSNSNNNQTSQQSLKQWRWAVAHYLAHQHEALEVSVRHEWSACWSKTDRHGAALTTAAVGPSACWNTCCNRQCHISDSDAAHAQLLDCTGMQTVYTPTQRNTRRRFTQPLCSCHLHSTNKQEAQLSQRDRTTHNSMLPCLQIAWLHMFLLSNLV